MLDTGLAARLLAPLLAWVAPLDKQTVCLPHEPVPSEEWASFLRTDSVAAEPRKGYEGRAWNPEWEHRSVVKVSVKFDVSRRTFFRRLGRMVIESIAKLFPAERPVGCGSAHVSLASWSGVLALLALLVEFVLLGVGARWRKFLGYVSIMHECIVERVHCCPVKVTDSKTCYGHGQQPAQK